MRFLGVLALAAAWLASPAMSAGWDDCMEAKDLAKKIRACTQQIDGGKLKQGQMMSALLHRAYAHRLRENWDAAIEDATAVIEGAPDRGRAFYERGMVLRAREEYRAAVQDLDIAARAMSGEPFVWRARGRVNFLLGNYWSAAQDLTEAIRLNPQDAWAYAYRAEVRCKQDRAEDALSDWQQFHIRDPDSFSDLREMLREHGFLGADNSLEALKVAKHAFVEAGCPGL